MAPSYDRTVHARYEGFEIVRYNRTGKWYLEPTDSTKRQQLTIAGAVQFALSGLQAGGAIHQGLPGGSTFDRKVAAEYGSASG